MTDIQTLVNQGYTQAAFKYKANAVKFLNAWKKKGYYISWLRSSGRVVDSDEHAWGAYYCIAEKNAPPPLSKKDERMIDEMERLDQLRKSNPRKYWETIVKPRLRGEIDPEIKSFVIELNNNDQFTTSSCAGHGNEKGHVFIGIPRFNGNLVRAIMKKHGLTGIERKSNYVTPEGDRYAVYEFNPVGRRK